MRARCLNNNDVITARVADHHPSIHNGTLFWNVMMRCRLRLGYLDEYNNGFGIVESEKQYIRRLAKIAAVIAEIVETHPDIEVISLCEGPVEPHHVELFSRLLRNYPCMEKFFTDTRGFYKPSTKPVKNDENIASLTQQKRQNWGLLLLADKQYEVKKIAVDSEAHKKVTDKLSTRFQLWKLENNTKKKFAGLAHFPFGNDERKVERNKLSVDARVYCCLIQCILKLFANSEFIFCADFNFNPYLISEWQDRLTDKISNNNSILLNKEKSVDTVTVDGILLSLQEKQKYSSSTYNPGLFRRLRKENNLASQQQMAQIKVSAATLNR